MPPLVPKGGEENGGCALWQSTLIGAVLQITFA
jgi:hypothetical protein